MPHKHQNIVVLTGAGISAESGVPVFRGEDGLWHGRRVEDVATADALARDPWGVNEFFNELRSFIKDIKPNAAHQALVSLEEAYGNNFLLVTQNVDPLHEKAGNKNLRHMHGELLKVACTACGQEDMMFECDVTQETPCPACGKTHALRPDITLFGEMPKHMDEIMVALASCDLFIAIGTSGNVYPAAGFVRTAKDYGAKTIELNLSGTEISYAFDEHIMGKAGETLPKLCQKLIG